MSGIMTAAAAGGAGIVVSISPTTISGVGVGLVQAGPVTVTVSGGRAPYTEGWVQLSGDTLTVSGTRNAYFQGFVADELESLFSNYQYVVTDADGASGESIILSVTLSGH